MSVLSIPKLQSEYVPREAQVGLLRRIVNYIRLSGPIFQTIYEWTGIPGIGKTVLVGMLCGACAEMGVPYARIDFNARYNPDVHKYAGDPILVIKELSEHLNRRGSTELEEAIREYESLPADNGYHRDLASDEVVRAFRRYVRELLERDPVVFLFDTTDKAPPVVLAWLEEHVVSFLSQTGRCIFVFAGRAPLHWHRFEVRRRVRSERLTAFEPELVEKQFKLDRKHPQLVVLSERAYRLTSGHPMGSAVVLRYLGELADQGECVNEETFPRYEPKLLDGLVREVIDGYVFRDVKPALANACRAMALLRQFDVILLRRILSEFVPDFREYPRDAFGGLLALLNATHLIDWDDVRKGYNVDSTLRRILSRYMRQSNPERYVGINKAALEVYQNWIERVTDNLSVYIIEEFYHYTCIAQVTRPQADWQTGLAERLQAYLDAYYTEGDPELQISALERLDKGLERDEELREPELIGEKGVNDLRQVIAEHVERLRQRVPTP